MAESDEMKRRQELALKAIKDTYGTEDGEFGSTLYVSHHLDELESSYWQEKTNNSKPSPEHVLGLLTLKSAWHQEDEEDEVPDTYDFALPGDVTDYVLSVFFNEDGEVEEISMES